MRHHKKSAALTEIVVVHENVNCDIQEDPYPSRIELRREPRERERGDDKVVPHVEENQVLLLERQQKRVDQFPVFRQIVNVECVAKVTAADQESKAQ